MSDYTPTTEEVRKIYADYRDDIREVDPLGSYPLSGQEFDRWIAEVKAQERKAERQRILALLTTDLAARRNSFMNGFIVGAAVVGVMLLIIQVPMTGGI